MVTGQTGDEEVIPDQHEIARCQGRMQGAGRIGQDDDRTRQVGE
jgi:hypothetical protein